MKWAIYAVLIFLTLSTALMEITNVFLCTPIKKVWDLTYRGGSCLDVAVKGIVGAVLNAFTDILVLILPLPILRSLNLPKGQKVAVMIIFLTGGLYVTFKT